MNEQILRDSWYINPDIKVNISTQLRKAIMLGNDLRVVFHGHSYEIKFKNLGGGIWQAYTEKMEFKNIATLKTLTNNG